MPDASGSRDGAVVVLIGAPAAGKTRVGKRVARRLELPFIDTDAVVVAEHGPIAEIFDTRGEGAFRELEAAAVRDALMQRAVVALGGGAVMTSAVAEAVREHPVVLLTVSAEAAAARLDPETRPLVRNGIEAWERLVESRASTYAALAAATWDTSSRPIDHIADEITDWVRSRESAQGAS